MGMLLLSILFIVELKALVLFSILRQKALKDPAEIVLFEHLNEDRN